MGRQQSFLWRQPDIEAPIHCVSMNRDANNDHVFFHRRTDTDSPPSPAAECVAQCSGRLTFNVPSYTGFIRLLRKHSDVFLLGYDTPVIDEELESVCTFCAAKEAEYRCECCGGAVCAQCVYFLQNPYGETGSFRARCGSHTHI